MPLRHQARRLHSSACVRVLEGRCATLACLWHFNWVCLIFEVVCGVIPYPYTHCLMACINTHNVRVWGVGVGVHACMWVWVSWGCVALQHCSTHSYIHSHDQDDLACYTCYMCRRVALKCACASGRNRTLHCVLRSNKVSNVRKVSNMFRSCNHTRSLQMYIGLVDWSLLKEKSSDHLRRRS